MKRKVTIFEKKMFQQSFILFLLFVDIMDSNNMYFVKTNETVNLNSIMPCNGIWTFDHKDKVSTSLVMLKDKIGVYSCDSLNKEMFVFTVDKNMTFEYTPVEQPHIIGDNVTLSCYVTFVAHDDAIRTVSTIYDSNSTLNVINELIVDNIYQKETTATVELDTNGNITYFCRWDYSHKGIRHNGSSIKMVSLRVYMTPRNVHPTEEMTKVNTTVLCLSEADPPASKYSWSCDNGNWSANGSSITYLGLGHYNCTCVVTNIISGQEYNSQWRGVIKVVSEEEYKNITAHAANTLAIVLGIIGGLALVGLVVGAVLAIEYMKGGRLFARKQDKNKIAEAGKEPLEVVDNQLYGKL